VLYVYMEDLLKQIEAISKPFSPLLFSGGEGGGVVLVKHIYTTQHIKVKLIASLRGVCSSSAD
jgi:hypothetical protein